MKNQSVKATLKGMHHVIATHAFGDNMTGNYLNNCTLTAIRKFAKDNGICTTGTKLDIIYRIIEAATNYEEVLS